jgi:pimeloyl-ACP methyl ester carboxylesterase
MKEQNSVGQVRRALTATAMVVGCVGSAGAQELADVKPAKTPLVLRERGSFMVGGETREQTPAQLSSIFGQPLDKGGHVRIHQMYVQYMVPMKSVGAPVVMMHGATLSGKTYETTPDGRMGWDEYFVRKGHAVYVPDQVSRARSGFDPTIYNDVRTGLLPANKLPNIFRQSDEVNWQVFRFGPVMGTPFPDEQFPVAAAEQMAMQAIPDLNAVLPAPNPTYKAMADLAVQLKGAVLMGHSESGAFPIHAALTNIDGVKGLILVEPGRCNGYGNAYLSEQDIATLARVPILAVFGDHLDVPTGMPNFSWKDAFEDCNKFIGRINAAGGKAEMLHPPALGIHGNSHMIMQDKNNLQIADLIMKWMDRAVDAKRGAVGK